MIRIFENISKDQRLFRVLEKAEVLDRERFKGVVARAKKDSISLIEAILRDEAFLAPELLPALSEFCDLPWIDLSSRPVAPQIIGLIPKEVSEQHTFVIFKKRGNIIQVATTAPENEQLRRFIEQKTGMTVEFHLATARDIRSALARFNRQVLDDYKLLDQSIENALSAPGTHTEAAQNMPIVRLVDSVIEKAIANDASDIHIEPGPKKLVIRYRIDGLLVKAREMSSAVTPLIIARLKILANLKIDEHMRPQDGRFIQRYNQREVAIRISIIPGLNGPKAALRLLEMRKKNYTLQKLGLNKVHLDTVRRSIESPHGIILVTGPTGSGKTTTLYTILRMLNKESVNISTIEDPIEYGVENINQMQIKPSVGLTFAAGLRALLRQDPNILMVGEIRDVETAEIAINAAMTGHLVLSTLHTNSAFQAPQRLLEMGTQPYLVNTVLNLAVGQRLVRKLCRYCRIEVRQPEKYLEEIKNGIDPLAAIERLKAAGLIPAEARGTDYPIFKARGCPRCNNTGYNGRIGIYEILPFSPELRRRILTSPSEADVKAVSLPEGVLTMAEDGLYKVLTGQTTYEEVVRVSHD